MASYKTMMNALGTVYQNPRKVVSYAYGNELTSALHPQEYFNKLSDTTDLATQEHENFHQQMRRIEQHHGPAARANLAKKMWSSIPLHIRKPTEEYTHSKTGYLGPAHQYLNEERIASLHDYLNDPTEREMYHKGAGHTDYDAMQHGNVIKKAFRHLQGAAKNANGSWLEAPVYKSELIKSEPDEVEKLLQHPDPNERIMALKLGQPQDKHLIKAFEQEDPKLHHHIFHNHELSSNVLMALMQMPDRQHSQLKALHCPNIDSSHLRALYESHSAAPFDSKAHVLAAIIKHPGMDEPLIKQLCADGHSQSVLDHPLAPAEALESAIAGYELNPEDDDRKEAIKKVVQNVKVPSEVLERMFQEVPPEVKLAIASAPNMPEPLAYTTMLNGQLPAHDNEAEVRLELLHNNHSERVLNTAVRDRDFMVAETAKELIMGWALNKSEPLAKMALIHNDPHKPKTVFRVQNEKGEGPYGYADFRELGQRRQPAPFKVHPGDTNHDFNEEDGSRFDADHVFGFESPEHADEWFGPQAMTALGQQGFSVHAIPASHVWRSTSGKQIFFRPMNKTEEATSGLIYRLEDTLAPPPAPEEFVSESPILKHEDKDSIVTAMLGISEHLRESLDAARWLSGGPEKSLDEIREAL